ncbi:MULTISPECIES: histidine phosphatase family protein [Bacillus]|uniref:histidine phosphatase family protein n=1 Tax=Bacillus TaxID=1386 RepID=UPI000319CC55|nr:MULTISPECIES: histidine phosphatase family protein [Bacillus]
MEFERSIHLILIRHGMTAFNRQKKYMGYTDEPILADSLLDYKKLRAIFIQKKMDKIFSSDLLRCQQTAHFLFGEQEICCDPRLREIHFGDWEGKTYEQLKNSPDYCYWLSNWQTASIPNGECGIDFKNRIIQFMLEKVLLNEHFGKSIAIVSHGGVIRHIVSSLCTDIDYWDVKVHFGQATELFLVKKEGEWTCTSSSVVPTVVSDNL